MLSQSATRRSPIRSATRYTVRWQTLGLLALGGLGGAAPAVAQDAPIAVVGSRVRVTTEGRPRHTSIGTIAELGSDSLILAGEAAGNRVALPRSAVTRVQLSLRRETRLGKHLAIGAASGGLIAGGGLFLASMASVSAWGDPASADFTISKGTVIKAFGIGIAAGALVGAIAGATNKTDAWASARLPDRTVAARSVANTRPLIGVGRTRDHTVLKLGVTMRL